MGYGWRALEKGVFAAAAYCMLRLIQWRRNWVIFTNIWLTVSFTLSESYSELSLRPVLTFNWYGEQREAKSLYNSGFKELVSNHEREPLLEFWGSRAGVAQRLLCMVLYHCFGAATCYLCYFNSCICVGPFILGQCLFKYCSCLAWRTWKLILLEGEIGIDDLQKSLPR